MRPPIAYSRPSRAATARRSRGVGSGLRTDHTLVAGSYISWAGVFLPPAPTPLTAWILPARTAAPSAPREVGMGASIRQRSLPGSYSYTALVGVHPCT